MLSNDQNVLFLLYTLDGKAKLKEINGHFGNKKVTMESLKGLVSNGLIDIINELEDITESEVFLTEKGSALAVRAADSISEEMIARWNSGKGGVLSKQVS